MANSKTNEDFFGFSPLMILGAAIGGIALLSWMGETATKPKGDGCGCSKGKTDPAPVADEGLGMIVGGGGNCSQLSNWCYQCNGTGGRGCLCTPKHNPGCPSILF